MILLTATRVMGAFFALFSSLFIVVANGLDFAGEYFLMFSFAYFTAQVVRYGGEIDILSFTSSDEAIEHISNIFSTSAFLSFMLFLIGLFSAITFENSTFLYVVISGCCIAFIENISDVIKKRGNLLVGTFLFSCPLHLVVIILISFGLIKSFELVLLLSSLISFIFVSAYYFSTIKNFSRVNISTPIFRNENFQAFSYNIINHAASPLFLTCCIQLYGPAIGANYRVSLRAATIVFFSYLAYQQLVLKNVDKKSGENFNIFANSLKEKFLIPTSFTLSCSVITFSWVLSKLGYFNSTFFNMTTVWALTFFISSFFADGTIYYVSKRHFRKISNTRLAALLFVCFLILLVSTFVLPWQFFSIVTAMFYLIPHIITYILYKRSINAI